MKRNDLPPARCSRRTFLRLGAGAVLLGMGDVSAKSEEPAPIFISDRLEPDRLDFGIWHSPEENSTYSFLGGTAFRTFTLTGHFRPTSDATTRLAFVIDQDRAAWALELHAGQNQATLKNAASGKWQSVASARLAVSPGVWHSLRIDFRNGECAVSVNAHPLCSCSFPALASGRLALSTERGHELANVAIVASGEIATYPPPGDLRDVPHLTESPRYRVTLERLPVFTYAHSNHYEGPADPGAEGPLRRSLISAAHFASAAFSGRSVRFEIEHLAGNINTCEVRPKRLGITPEFSGRFCRFTLTEPRHLVLLINGRDHPLFLWTDSPEVPGEGPPVGGGTRYFAAGVHHLGLRTPIGDDSDVYLAGGAVVLGTFLSESSSGLTRVTIRGRGILCGSPWPWTTDRPEGWLDGLIALRGGRWSDSRIDGVILLDSPSWTLGFDKVRTQVSRVKIVGTRTNNDGVWFGPGCTVRDCFMAVNDDPLRPNTRYNGTEPALAENCVIWKMPIGSVLKCFVPGPGDAAPAANFTFRGIDVVMLEEGLGGVFTFLTLRTGAGQPLRDFVFEDIHVDEWPAGGRRTLFRCLLPAANTEVRGLRFTRLDTPVANGRIAADGPGSRLSEIVFEGCRVAGLPLRHLSQTTIAIGDNVSAVVIRP